MHLPPCGRERTNHIHSQYQMRINKIWMTVQSGNKNVRNCHSKCEQTHTNAHSCGCWLICLFCWFYFMKFQKLQHNKLGNVPENLLNFKHIHYITSRCKVWQYLFFSFKYICALYAQVYILHGNLLAKRLLYST